MMATTGTDDDHGDNGDNDRGREGQDAPMQGGGTRPDDAIEIGEDDDDDVDDDKGGVRVDKGEPGDPPPAGGDSGGNNHNKSDVDEIDDEIDDDDTGKVHLPCRPHRLGCMLDPSPSPIKLFATKQDEELRQERLHHPNGSPPSGATNWQQQQQQEQEQHWSFVHCWTFREMMGLDRMWGPMNGGGIDFVVIGTYILDVDFLLAELPELLDVPVVVVVYQYKDPSLDGSEIAWQAHVDRRRRAGHAATLVMLERNPRADPNGGGGDQEDANPLSVRMEYGCHHAKFVLVGYRSQRLRVVIHTSNLRRQDVHLKCQGAYIQDFLPKTEDQMCSFATSDFEEALIQYLESYRYLEKHSWSSSSSGSWNGLSHPHGDIIVPTTLVAHLQTYDFSTAVGVLVPSIPGFHSSSWQRRGNGNGNGTGRGHQQSPVLGYLKVQQAIAEHTTTPTRSDPVRGGHSTASLMVARTDNGRYRMPTIVCQFSSIGSLSKPYLDKVAAAWSVDSVHARNTTPSNTIGPPSKNPYQPRPKRPKIGPADEDQPTHRNLTIVWPTIEEIVESVEGPRGGATVPGRSNNVGKDFLQPLYHKWRSRAAATTAASGTAVQGGTSDDDRHYRKGRHVPHIKTYYEIENQNEEDSMKWFVLTSHNLSKAAWGEIQNRRDRGEVLTIQHWELGVFVSPKTLGVDSMGPASNGSHHTKSLAANQTNIKRRAVIPLPYNFRPESYDGSDQPWVVDLLG